VAVRPSDLCFLIIKSHEPTCPFLKENFSERRGDLYAKAKLAMGKPEELPGVITAIQKYNLDAAKVKGAIPLINGTELRRAMVAKPEKKLMLYENIFELTGATLSGKKLLGSNCINGKSIETLLLEIEMIEL